MIVQSPLTSLDEIQLMRRVVVIYPDILPNIPTVSALYYDLGWVNPYEIPIHHPNHHTSHHLSPMVSSNSAITWLGTAGTAHRGNPGLVYTP